jgi:hypothetical protein
VQVYNPPVSCGGFCIMFRITRTLLLVLLVTAPLSAVAGLECGYLYGTRQTAIRLAQSGWSFQDVLNISLDQPYYRNITDQERVFLIRVVQEAYFSRGDPVSPLIVDFCQAEIARQNAAKPAGGAPAQGGSPGPAE